MENKGFFNWRSLLLLGAFFTFATPAYPTHIVGGELNYRYLGSNNYEIRLTVYRDCFNGIPPFDSPASLGIFDAANNLVREVLMTFRGSDTIPPTINSPCFNPPTNICYERTTYIDTVNLPPALNGYQLAYQRCCRNHTILNIITPDAVGATYYASIPASIFLPNDNPVFTNWPPPFICAGLPFVFDHSATDLNGDSIVYELCVPYNGADTTMPMPQPPFNPPYQDLIWQFPYDLSNLLGGIPLKIDRFTGMLTATPNTIGQFVVGVCAHEFRNGIYLSTTKRDFQLNVVPCPTYVVAALQNPIIDCRTHEVTFDNLSINAGSFHWDFGVPNMQSDTSNDIEPIFYYPDTGVYTVTLIAYSNVDPTCADTVTGTVTILDEYQASVSHTLDSCSNQISFFDTSNTISGSTNSWRWEFGDGSFSTLHNPKHNYPSGLYTATLFTTSTRGCKDTVQVNLQLNPLLTLDPLTVNPIRCHGECNGQLTVSAANGYQPYNYTWSNGSSSTAITGLCQGNYQVTVTDDAGCTKSASYSLVQPDTLLIDVSGTVAYCAGICTGTATTVAQGGSGNNTYQWNDPSLQTSSKAINLCQGTYTVLVTDQRGCTAADSVVIAYSDSLPSLDVTADTLILYLGQSTLLHAQSNNVQSYQWTPSNSLNNASLADPLATPTETTKYQATVRDSNGCITSDTVTIQVRKVTCIEPEFFIPNAFSPDGDHSFDRFLVSGYSIESFHISIFDRWGEKVYESRSQTEGWDGTFRGKALPPDVYVYIIEAQCWDKQTFTRKGNITLMR